MLSARLNQALHALKLRLRMQLAYPLLEASGNGSIVMNSSVAGGPAAINTGSLYAMSKGAAALDDGHFAMCLGRHSVASVPSHMEHVLWRPVHALILCVQRP